ncbi:YifB family Mg chelatase-like AAA ATPase [Neobacillus cucumis]|uniref:YifB family Mg chelatase-like AAA ATPase n=1 Tax=Neobacillus cucumis TaxID=1740721 RepID=UPI00285369B6|nr:YifB family Mg chelatase-like AAA ATPase [Neobacillus cucumis]MDR4949513.1 YifB family Mg chelatase-like AAA ATPase [Neobacillus cucumis]
MWARVTSIGLKGMDGYRVNVEVGTYVGNDSFKIVGLPDAAVKESKERIIAALGSLGVMLHGNKIIINLSPADQKKMGPMFDFPMAMGVLLSLHEIEAVIPEDTGFIGALSLSGALQPVEGMLPAILSARKLGIQRLYIPVDEQLPDLDFIGLDLIYVTSLKDVIGHLTGQWTPSTIKKVGTKPTCLVNYHLDFQQIIGQDGAKHALEVAAAGEHHVLMTGPPGCGKSLLAESFPSILPPLTKEAQLEVLSLYQLSRSAYSRNDQPPFRSPHHSASGISIIGGGQIPRPGEISLAHHGVLFLDEIGEFPKKTLDLLRQPLENGFITISRTHASITYPASFLLIAARNPCPCGYAGSNTHYCTCSTKQIISYQNRLSGPLRDRFDINLSLRAINIEAAATVGKGESSKIVRERVQEARERQYQRYGGEMCNSRAPYEVLVHDNPITEVQQTMLQQLALEKNWTNRTQIKIIRLARTIADLQGSSSITDQNIHEAIQLNGDINGDRHHM